MKILLYTTSRSSWFQQKAERVAEVFAKKIPGFTIDVVNVNIPRNVVTIVDRDGHRRFAWDWLQTRFPKTEEYDGVGFHFTQYYKDKWDITPSINGARNSVNRQYPEFWIAAEQKEMAGGYDDLSEFERLLFHELSHFFEDLDDEFGDHLMQQSVHLADYDLKRIHLYPYLIDYRGYLIKLKVKRLITQVINLIRKMI